MRRLVAALACRNGGTRLYGKPLQNLSRGVTILDQILATINSLPEIETPVLGISEGSENEVFAKIAAARGIPFIVGDERDVLARLIACGKETAATDIFRITTECPFMNFERVAGAWRDHVDHSNDITVIDDLPEGTAFEIYTLGSLQRSHDKGTEEHRSEMCSRYAKQHPAEFQIETLQPEAALRRLDLRLTVDYPEDMIVCREVYSALVKNAPLIPLADIIAFLDLHPELKSLVQKYVTPGKPWRSSSAAKHALA